MRNIDSKRGLAANERIRQSETFDSKVAHRMPFPEFFSSLLVGSFNQSEWAVVWA